MNGKSVVTSFPLPERSPVRLPRNSQGGQEAFQDGLSTKPSRDEVDEGAMQEKGRSGVCEANDSMTRAHA